ncbi:glycosyltransferase family 2 protein [Stutzerimonas chloritidismutans]|uniref:glycosyltransferase family 2 protein n=1 Tax=Stutzerimonas chloritidismutans TaxID=203192 RepID=UPI00384E87B3
MVVNELSPDDVSCKIAVVIPCYKVKNHIIGVINSIGPEVWRIFIIDDCCPVNSGDFVVEHNIDPRVHVIRLADNQGVGGAVMAGYTAAIEQGAEIIVKIDGDGQMDPSLLYLFVNPIISGQADYCKGNRFFDLTNIGCMPKMRLFGNAVLSFMTKLSTGYWQVFDPTNGYTAIDAKVAAHLPFASISKRYFFETDMLFRLNTLRAAVLDIPMDAQYGDEESNLKISKILFEFLGKHARNFGKRIFYNYFLRNMSLASLEIVAGIIMLLFGLVFGFLEWNSSAGEGVETPVGTVMFAALPILLGIQFLLAFFAYDIASSPRIAISKLLSLPRKKG